MCTFQMNFGTIGIIQAVFNITVHAECTPWRSFGFSVIIYHMYHIEGIAFNGENGIWNGNGCQVYAVIKGIARNRGDRIWNGNGSQTGAIHESTASNISDSVWNGNVFKACAIAECAAFNGSD